MQIFNLVCPRPRILPSRPKSPTKTSRAANYDAFRAAEAAAAAAHTQGASERSVDVPETADPLGGAKKPGFFSRLFQRAPAAAAARVRAVGLCIAARQPPAVRTPPPPFPMPAGTVAEASGGARGA